MFTLLWEITNTLAHFFHRIKTTRALKVKSLFVLNLQKLVDIQDVMRGPDQTLLSVRGPTPQKVCLNLETNSSQIIFYKNKK